MLELVRIGGVRMGLFKKNKQVKANDPIQDDEITTSSEMEVGPQTVQSEPVAPQNGQQLPNQQQMINQQGQQPLIEVNQNGLQGQQALANGNQPGANNGDDLINSMTSSAEFNKKVDRPVKRFHYIIINTMGKKEQGNFDAENADDVRNFLISQEYQVLEVKERGKYDIDLGGNGRLKSSDLAFCLTQLSTYIKSGIPLADSVKILAKQSHKASMKKSFIELVYELLRGESLSSAMEKQSSTYPQLLINMIKTAEMTGDLPSILDDMADYYTTMDQTKKQMKSAMTYPLVVLTIAFAVLIFMLTYLVPQFATMFEANNAELPALTLTILAVSDFIKTNWFILLIVIVALVLGFYFAYKKIQKFRKAVQTMLMHLPVIKNVIIYNEVANFTKTFASLINHGVFITDSMEILSKITNNEIFKGIISKSLTNLAKGDSISTAFKGEWAIPIVAYEMLVTGETTGQLGTMMEKVASHFQMLHKNIIDQMKSLVEPLLICFLAVVVGIILMSIIQPMFAIYEQVQ